MQPRSGKAKAFVGCILKYEICAGLVHTSACLKAKNFLFSQGQLDKLNKRKARQ